MSVRQPPAATPVLRRRPTLPAAWALAGAAVSFTSLYLAAGALTPLLVLYKEQWRFLPRRVRVGWVIAGRIVQGLAGGAGTTAFTAALVELAPPDGKRLGTILGSVGLSGGLALGSLLAGLAIQLTTAANTIIFVVLDVVTVLGIAATALSPEIVPRASGALRSLVPRIAVPPATRVELLAATPVIAAVWMLAGLSGGLAPSMVRSVFNLDSGLLNGVSGFIAPAVSAVIALASPGRPPTRDDDRHLRVDRRGSGDRRRRAGREPGAHDGRPGGLRPRLRRVVHRGPAADLPARAIAPACRGRLRDLHRVLRRVQRPDRHRRRRSVPGRITTPPARSPSRTPRGDPRPPRRGRSGHRRGRHRRRDRVARGSPRRRGASWSGVGARR
jgi:hypothetical protein